MQYVTKKIIRCTTHFVAFLALAFSGLLGCHESDSSGKGPVVSFRILGSDGLSLTNNLALRLANIEFDVFVTCDPQGDTSSLTFQNYTLGDIEQFSLDARCTNADVNLKNIDVSYTNVDNNVVVGTFVNYASTINNNNSTLLFEKTVTGSAAEFRFREKTVVGQSNSHVVAVAGIQVNAELLNKPNSYCSGVTVAVAANTVTATFDAPEAGTPAGTYIFSADRTALPALAVEVKTGASVSYDFSAVTGAESTGTYVFTMEMTPDVGQPHADEICSASVSINLQPAAINHAPTFHYDNHLNVSDFTGLGTATDPYAFTLTIDTSNGQVSFRITDEDGQSTALIKCNNKPAWVIIDDANDRITFSPTSSGSVTFDCHANDGTTNSFTSVYFNVSTVPPYSDPSLSLSAPSSAVNLAIGTASYNIQFTATNPNSDASIKLYYRLGSAAGCNATNIGDWTQIDTGISAAATSYAFNTSALAAANYHFCGSIGNGVNPDIYALASGYLKINAAPTITVTAPSTALVVGQSQSTTIGWNAADSDDDAQISLYRHTSAAGACTTGTLITSGISENAQGMGGSYSWSLAAVPVGTYYICARITDGVNPPVDSWSSGTITPNVKPTVAFTAPAANAEFEAGATVTINWTAVDPDDLAAIKLYLKTSGTGACADGTLLLDTTMPTATFDWDTTSVTSDQYHLCVSADDGKNTLTEVHRLVSVYRICGWAGTSSTDWAEASNWTGCNAMSPRSTDFIYVPSAAPHQPTLAASTTINAIASSATNGGMVTLANARLTVRKQDSFRSSIGFRGATAGCLNCEVYSDLSFEIINGATLTLGSNAILRTNAWHGELRVGTTTSHGHFVTEDSSAGLASTQYWLGGIRVDGSAGNLSSVDISGLWTHGLHRSRSEPIIHFVDHYQIKKLDNITLNAPSGTGGSNNERRLVFIRDGIRLAHCSTAVFDTLSWNHIQMVCSFGLGRGNIDLSHGDCSDAGPFNISGAGHGFGSAFAKDPNSRLNFSLSDKHYCEWSAGAATSDWSDPDNWSYCDNTSGFPISSSWVHVPASVSPSVAVNTLRVIQGFQPTGVPMAEITLGATLRLTSMMISQDITFIGSSPTCGTCTLSSGSDGNSNSIWIVNNAKLTLKPRVSVLLSWGAYVYVGSLDSPGHFAVTDVAEVDQRPFITSNAAHHVGLRVEGNATQRSTLDINGINLLKLRSENTSVNILLFDHFEVKKLDNISFNANTVPTNVKAHVEVASCNNSLFTDTHWQGLNFASAMSTTGRNIAIVADSCSSLNPITVQATGPGSGVDYENNPHGVIVWE